MSKAKHGDEGEERMILHGMNVIELSESDDALDKKIKREEMRIIP